MAAAAATTTRVTHRTVAERAALGKARREAVPRSSHASWSSGQRTHQPLDLLAEQATTRLPDLVPLRHFRMAASPFSYYRGAAYPMAADLATTPSSGLRVQLCGDAHLANFGGFAAPDRRVVFDVNDFDETNPGPFEWDVKRLAASLEVAGRANGFAEKDRQRVVAAAVRQYQSAMAEFAGQTPLDIWYSRLDVDGVIERWGSEAGLEQTAMFRKAMAKNPGKDRIAARAKLTEVVDGELRFRSDPPILVPIEEMLAPDEIEAMTGLVTSTLRAYRRTLPGDRRHLLEAYRFTRLARKVVGVGSVGTRCWVSLHVGRDENDVLILQMKEAEASDLNHGQRVVEGQRLVQASSDVFLGWHRVEEGVDGRRHDYYVRQLWDAKISAAIEAQDPVMMGVYARMCGWTLARGHARSGDPVAISAYLGTSDTFPRALIEFATAYADQNEVDHIALVAAIAEGRVAASDH
jgi:hypothetical protein